MASPPRRNIPSPIPPPLPPSKDSSNYNLYRPTSLRQDSQYPLYNPSSNSLSTPMPPPHSRSPGTTDPFDPYPRSYTDYSSPGYSASNLTATPYSDLNRSDGYFEPLHPTQSYQDQYIQKPGSGPYNPPEEAARMPRNSLPTPPPNKPRTLLSRIFDGDQRFAYFCWTISIIQIGVFIGELVHNGLATGTPIEIQPTFNPLIGPSPYVLINMGARFDACMHAIPGITDLTSNIWPCLNNTANPSSDGSLCSLSDICGFGGFTGTPNQWYRIIVPIFLHAGILHILFNLLVQLRLGVEVEKDIGTIRFILVYFPSGIMGFILGANFAGNGVASTGCSGPLFGIIALVLLDLGYNWNSYQHPKRQLAILLIQVIVCFVLGLLPGLDNFSHLGGFATGLLLGIAVMRAPPRIRARISPVRSSVYDLDAPYSSLTGNGTHTTYPTTGYKGILGYFRGRKRWWWIWTTLRVVCLSLTVIFLALLVNNFYANGGGHCGWCRYLSCLPVDGWCELGNIQTTNSTTPSRMARSMYL